MCKYISSKNNRIYIEAKKLNESKYRSKRGLCLIDGEKIVLEAVRKGIAKEIFVSGNYNIRDDFECKLNILSNELFSNLSLSKSPQGIIAVAEVPTYSEDFFLSNTQSIAILDSIQDPGNLGNIIRTGYASYLSGVLLVGASADLFSNKVIRASAGICFDMPYIICKNSKEAIRICKQKDIKIVAADMSGVSYNNISIESPMCLAFGSEGSGLSDDILSCADFKVKIPMREGLDSLNVSTSAALMLYKFIGRV